MVDKFLPLLYNIQYKYNIGTRSEFMRRNAVAVLDVRSADITALIAEKGVNNTFIFKGSASTTYFGYESGKFIRAEFVKAQITTVLNKVLSSCGKKISELFIGVPAEFLYIRNSDGYVSFSSRKKISDLEIEKLFLSEKGKVVNGYSLIDYCAAGYILSDGRKVSDPKKLSSASLSGELSYIYLSDYYSSFMIEAVKGAFDGKIKFIPSALSEVRYLTDEEQKSGEYVFADIGIFNSELVSFGGDGIRAVRSVNIGEATVMDLISKKYSISDEDAVNEIIRNANLYLNREKGNRELPLSLYPGKISYGEINGIIMSVLDELCGEFFRFFKEIGKDTSFKGVCVTGDGLLSVNGAQQYLSAILNLPVEPVRPKLPYYKKEQYSVSAISILDMAYNSKNCNNSGVLFKFLLKFGG